MGVTVIGVLGQDVQIIAADVDTGVLETVRKGVYTEERVSKFVPDLIKRYFLRGTGELARFVRVRPKLAEMITIRQLNLRHNNCSLRFSIDVILCRNVMIYFDKQAQLDMLKKFRPLLCSSDLLFAGYSESFHHADEYFKLRGKIVYELPPTFKAQHKVEVSR